MKDSIKLTNNIGNMMNMFRSGELSPDDAIGRVKGLID